MKYSDVKAMASLWGLTERRVTALCRNGRINGAKKEGGLWFIPESAQKPCDGRRIKFAQAVKKLLICPCQSVNLTFGNWSTVTIMLIKH